MSLLLKWAKRNATPVITEIYRSNSPIDKAALPPVLVTLSNQEVQYVDATAVVGQTYHYMWITYNMQHGSPAYSPSTPILVAQRRGVGPNTLISGNSDVGYFGDVSQSDLITTQGLIAFQLPGSGALPSSSYAYVWRKCMYKGKIIYCPSAPQFLTRYDDVYKAGYAIGNQDRSKLPYVLSIDPTGAIVQNRTITIGGDQYIIRLLRGFSDDQAIPVPADINTSINTANTQTDTTPAVRYANEYDALYLPNINLVPYWQELPNFPDVQTPATGTRYGTVVAELVNPTTSLVRGPATDANAGSLRRTGLTLYRASATNIGSQAVMLVLELVEA